MEHPVVLFDGECNYCNSMVNLVIRLDKEARIRFAALQSAAGQRLLREHGLPGEGHQSFLLFEGRNVYDRSTAALRIVRYLPWYLQEARLFWIVPRPFRNAIYDFISRNRYKWFGRRNACMVPTPEVKARFLD
ncbi:MAG: thiol-disulfide oxidoreductase DCC family protein [Chitinophagaceae bacterium]|nr:MAG: thiol-disulfide oxidoreductase DCC family protein [Chitinophagaceae bacterium]